MQYAKTSLWLDQNIGLHKHNLCITHTISYNGCVILNWEVRTSHTAYYCIWYVANSLKKCLWQRVLIQFLFQTLVAHVLEPCTYSKNFFSGKFLFIYPVVNNT